MNREESIKLMLTTFQDMNRIMASQAGMDEKVIEDNITQSNPSIEYMLTAVYDKMLENDLIKA